MTQDAMDIEETLRQLQLDYQIDPAEPHRVPLGTGQGRATEPDATALLAETALLQAQIDNLRQMGELLRNELEHLNSQADRLLLTQSAPAAPAKPAGWLRRLAGSQAGLVLNDLLP